MISLVYNTMKQARNRHGRTCFHCSELGEIFGLCKWITHEKAKTKIELREGNKINALKIDLDVLGTLKREELVFKQPIKLYLKSLGNSFDTYDRHEKDIISALEKNTKLSVWCTQKSYWKTLKDNHTRLFGKIDAIASLGDQNILIEIKTRRGSAPSFPVYDMCQLSAYMYLANVNKCLFVQWVRGRLHIHIVHQDTQFRERMLNALLGVPLVEPEVVPTPDLPPYPTETQPQDDSNRDLHHTG